MGFYILSNRSFVVTAAIQLWSIQPYMFEPQSEEESDTDEEPAAHTLPFLKNVSKVLPHCPIPSFSHIPEQWLVHINCWR